MPMMMAIMEPQQQQQQQQQQHQQDITGNSRPGLTPKVAESHPSQPFIPPEDDDKDKDKDRGKDPAPPLQALSGPDIIPHSDDQSISLAENSNPPQAHSQHTTQPVQSQNQSSPTQQTQSMRPQRQRRSTANHIHNNPGHSPTATKGGKATPTSSASRSHVTSQLATISAIIAPPASVAAVTSIEAPDTPPLPYTPAGEATSATTTIPSPGSHPQHQGHIIAGDGVASSPNPPTIEQAASPSSSRPGKRSNPDSDERATEEFSMVETQTQTQVTENVGSDVSTEKGVQLEKETSSLDPNLNCITKPATIATLSALSDRDSLEAQGLIESDPMGAGIKRETRPARTVGPQGTVPSKGKDVTGMPAKKRAKMDQAKKGENDTASLFQKICKCHLSECAMKAEECQTHVRGCREK